MDKVVALFLLFMALAAFLVLYEEKDTGPFRVVDGDTVKGRYTYRAIYIDTPELGKPKAWHTRLISNLSCLRWAAQRAKEEIGDRLSFVIYKPWQRDRWGRQLALFNGGELELELVREGWAFCYYRKRVLWNWLDERKRLCLSLEREAQEEGRGMWGCTPKAGIGS